MVLHRGYVFVGLANNYMLDLTLYKWALYFYYYYSLQFTVPGIVLHWSFTPIKRLVACLSTTEEPLVITRVSLAAMRGYTYHDWFGRFCFLLPIYVSTLLLGSVIFGSVGRVVSVSLIACKG